MLVRLAYRAHNSVSSFSVQLAKETDLCHQEGMKKTFEIAGQIHSYLWLCGGGYTTQQGIWDKVWVLLC